MRRVERPDAACGCLLGLAAAVIVFVVLVVVMPLLYRGPSESAVTNIVAVGTGLAAFALYVWGVPRWRRSPKGGQLALLTVIIFALAVILFALAVAVVVAVIERLAG